MLVVVHPLPVLTFVTHTVIVFKKRLLLLRKACTPGNLSTVERKVFFKTKYCY